MSTGTILGFTAGAVLFTFLTILAIPTINWYNGNGFKLLISSSSKQQKHGLVIGGKFESDIKYVELGGEAKNSEDVDLTEYFTPEERLSLRDILERMSQIYGNLMEKIGLYYKKYDFSNSGKIGKFSDNIDSGGESVTFLDIYNKYKDSSENNFDFDPKEICDYVRADIFYGKNLKYHYNVLNGLLHKIGSAHYMDDGETISDCNDERIRDIDLTEELPRPNMVVCGAL